MVNLLRSVALLAIGVSLIGGAYTLYAACPDLGPVDQGCDVGQGADSDCAGTQAACPNDDAHESTAAKFGCGRVVGDKLCRDGIIQDLCYTSWDCEWSVVNHDCLKAANTADPHTWWIKTSDKCKQEQGD